MASKFGLAGGIPERRVRPIWDAIDSRQFKSALKHSAALLSKYPCSPYALALKALILERMGKPDEALSVCISAKEFLFNDESALMDDLTLSTLQSVFQRLDHLDLATSCYEYACMKFPNNLDLMIDLFTCYVRMYMFVKQQQTAIKMYKLAGEERFLLWAVCSIQLQVFSENGKQNLLLLAEGLLKKHISSHGLSEPEALHVYLSILEQQSKFGEGLEIISGKLGSLITIDVDKLKIKGKLLVRLGDYSAAADVYQQILMKRSDDWECFQRYLQCLLEHPWDKESPDFYDTSICFERLNNDVFDSRISQAQNLVQQLQTVADIDSNRSPHLGLLEIARLKHVYGKDVQDEIITYLLRYYDNFGQLACFVSDTEAYVHNLSPNKKMEFLSKLKDMSTSICAEPSKLLGYRVTFFKVQELIGRLSENSFVPDLYASAVYMVELYCKNLKLSKNFDMQESVLGEDLLTIVSNTLVELYIRTKQMGYCVEAILVLEFGLTVRRHVWQYKVLLLHLYVHIGSYTAAYNCYKSLDVKNILMETFMHNILHQMLMSTMWNDLGNMLKDYIKFMDDHLKEAADLTFLAYRHKNYSKVVEFVLFKERLQNSNQRLVIKFESSFLLMKQKANNITDEEGVLESLNCGIHFLKLSEEIRSKYLSFNEDISTRPWWTPNPLRNFLPASFDKVVFTSKGDLIKEMEENVRRDMERKLLYPRMIYLSIQSAAVSFKENEEANGSAADAESSSELKNLLERYAKILGFSFVDAALVIHDVYDGKKSSQVFGSDVVDWMNFAVFLNAWSLSCPQAKSEGGSSLWDVATTLLDRCISEEAIKMGSRIRFPLVNLSVLVRLITEPLAWHCLVIQSCARSSQPSGKKRRKGGSAEQTSFLCTENARDSAATLRGSVEAVADRIKELLGAPEEENVECLLSSVAETEGDERRRVSHVLLSSVANVEELEVGHKVEQSLKSWNSADVARRIVSGTCDPLAELLHMCESKVKALLTCTHHLPQA